MLFFRLIATMCLFQLAGPGVCQTSGKNGDFWTSVNAKQRRAVNEAARLELSFAIDDLRSDELVRVEGLNGVRVAGRYSSVVDDALIIKVEEGHLLVPKTVPLASVERLWTGQRNTMKGALIGGGVGVVLGFIVGAALSKSEEGDVDVIFGFENVGVGMSTVVGLFTGMSVGAGIGSVVKSWTVRYP